nr:MAG TPA: hypothetical protein [Inoviridae sp.]
MTLCLNKFYIQQEYGILRIWLAIVADSDYNKRL